MKFEKSGKDTTEDHESDHKVHVFAYDQKDCVKSRNWKK